MLVKNYCSILPVDVVASRYISGGINTHTHTHSFKQPNTDVIVGAADGTGFFVDDRFVGN